MVTKLYRRNQKAIFCYILAKNHMVTKRRKTLMHFKTRYILAKNHMVTKQNLPRHILRICYILAKNHMVTKPQIS